MNDVTKLAVVPALAIGLTLGLSGCGESSSPDDSSHSADDGHDHGEEGHEDHDHGAGGQDEHSDDHGDDRSLGTIEAAGTTLNVSIAGEVEPGMEVHIELEHAGGPVPTAVRLWIGDEAGTNSLKAKADGHDDHFHAHIEAPNELSGAALWIEVEAAGGTRTTTSVPLD